jgi:hypothetical protein
LDPGAFADLAVTAETVITDATAPSIDDVRRALVHPTATISDSDITNPDTQRTNDVIEVEATEPTAQNIGGIGAPDLD